MYIPGQFDGQNLELYLQEELQRISEAIFPLDDGQIRVRYNLPAKPRSGLYFADGTDWNPGSGKGAYRYDEATQQWIFLEAQGTLTAETDPTVPAHVKAITSGQVTNWDTAFGWGDHAAAGYLPKSAGSGHALTGDLYMGAQANWIFFKDLAGNDLRVNGSTAGKIDFYNQTATQYADIQAETGIFNDLFIGGSQAIVAADVVNWDTAFGWGNHATQGYLTDIIQDTTPTLGGNLDLGVYYITDTNHGRVGMTLWGSAATTAADWSNEPNGTHRMVRNTVGTAAGAPVNNYGYFTKVSQRDSSGGWGGLWVGYAAGENYVGRTSTNATFASWEKLWTDTDFTSTQISNWDTAFGWGDHAGLYAAASHTHGPTDITGAGVLQLDGSGSSSFRALSTAGSASIELHGQTAAYIDFSLDGTGGTDYGGRIRYYSDFFGFDGVTSINIGGSYWSTTDIANHDTAFGWGDHAAAGYAVAAGFPDFTNGLATSEVRTRNGTELLLNAGESHAYATGQTNERVYVNAEAGFEINSSPDNWATGWASRKTAVLCDANGNSTLPGALTVNGNIIVTGTVDGVDLANVLQDSDIGVSVQAWDADLDTMASLGLSPGSSAPSGSQVLRSHTNGYTYVGWLNTVSGATTTDPVRIYASQDSFLRYMTPANFIDFLQGEPWDFTAAMTFPSDVDFPYGIHGGYSDAATTAFGATIWAIDTSWQGGVAGSNSANTNVYGIRWHRSTSTTGNTSIGEGVHLYTGGTLRGGIGTVGIYTTGQLRVDGNIDANGNIVGDGASTISGIETVTIDSTGDITKASHGNYLYHQSTSYNGDQAGGITFSTAAPSGGVNGDIWFEYT